MKNNKMTREEKRRLLFNKKYEISQKRIQKYGTDSVGAIAVDFNKRFVAAFLALVFALSCLVVGVNFASRAEENVDRTYLISNGASLEDGFAMLDDVDSTDGMVLRKGLKKNNDGTYDLRMEAYATGADKTVIEQVPTDFVLVLDQSGSMKTKDMPTGGWEEAGSSWSVGDDIAESDTAYYYKVGDGDNAKYYRVYAQRGYLYKYYAGNTLYSGDVVPKSAFHLFASGDVTGKGNSAYFFKEGDTYHQLSMQVGWGALTYWLKFSYTNNAGKKVQLDRGDYPWYKVWGSGSDYNIIKHEGNWAALVYYDTIHTAVKLVSRDSKEYTYGQFGSYTTGQFLNFDTYRRFPGYNKLCYKDEDGNVVTLWSAEYCNANKKPVADKTDTTEYKYSGTLYKAKDNESRLQALNTAAKSFVDLVANQTKTKADGSTEKVDHRISVVGFSSENNSYYTYNNTELLSPDSAVDDVSPFSGVSLDGGVGHDGAQYSYSTTDETGGISTEEYHASLIQTKTDAGKESLKQSIDYVTAYGGTQPQVGFKMAKYVIKSRDDYENDTTYTKADGTQGTRNVAVIFFTDGRPGNYDYSNQYEVANKVVAASQELKTLGAKVYSIGVFGESDANPLTYSKYKFNSSTSTYSDGYVSYTTYRSSGGSETYEEIRDGFAYDYDYESYYEDYDSGVYFADILYRICQPGQPGYTAEATDTIADYMQTVSSEYPNATEFINSDWYDSNSTPSTDYDVSIENSRGTPVDKKYYYVATDTNALIKAFSQIFDSTSADVTTSKVTIDGTNSYLKDIITDQFDTSNATGTVSVYSATNITDVTDGNPTVNSWTLVDPTPSGIDVSYSSNTVTDSDFKKAWEVTGFDYSDHYVAAANTAKAQKVVLTISGLTTTNTGSLTTNSSDSGIYTYATTSGESDSKESSFPVPTTSRKKYDLQYTGDNALGTDVMVMLKLSNNGAPVSGTFSGLIFDEKGLAEWTNAADDSELIVEDLPSDYKLEAYVINKDSSGSFDYTLKLDDTDEAFWQSDSTTNAFELTKTEQTITIDSTANSKDVTIIETTTGTYANTERAFPITLTLKDKDNNYVSGTYTYELGDGTIESVTFTEGVGSISLSNGQSATLKALPYNSTLTVTPDEATYYTQTVQLGSDTAETSKTTTINSDGITFNVNYARQDVTDSGILDNTNPISKWMFILAGALAVLAIIFAVWQKRKKNLTE